MLRINFLVCGAIVAIGLQLAGCYTDFGPIVTEPEPINASAVAARLQTGDKLKVTVYGEENLTGVYDVSPAGNVTMPLIGAIRAAGRTSSELERAITGAYRNGNLLQDPKVTVAVVEFRPYYIMGEAVSPGQFPYRSGLNVLTAISTAGGLTYRASRSSVLIQHAGQTGWEEYAMTANVLIAPGDLIRIPERYF
jgi:protein involved in polysaccharide export with SLBB domain